MSPLHVLYEDNHLLVVNKPAGLPTMGAEAGRESLIDRAKAYLKRKYDKPGNVYLGVVSRLDSMVSGVLVIARTSKAAARLTEQFKGRDVVKRYWAVVEQPLEPPTGECIDDVAKNERQHRMQVADGAGEGTREARLKYRTLSRVRGGYLLEIELITGRKHQIRVQLSHRGAPILGDRKYGATRRFEPGIALHAQFLELTHPVRKTRLQFTAPLPPAWQVFGSLPQRG